MPHKHKGGVSASAGVSKDRTQSSSSKKRAKRKALDKQERIPRELTRLLGYANGVKPTSGLDEGDGRASKPAKSTQKGNQAESTEPAKKQPPQPQQSLKILPGERLGDYSARVDASLPVAGLAKKGKGKDVPGSRPYRSKLERRMQRMQAEWRAEDVKIKEQREEAAQELEDQLDEMLPGVGARHSSWGAKSKDDDPWAVIDQARKQKTETARGLVGLHDVAHAPPQLKLGKPKLKDHTARSQNTMKARR